jgi:hypothetical protein
VSRTNVPLYFVSFAAVVLAVCCDCHHITFSQIYGKKLLECQFQEPRPSTVPATVGLLKAATPCILWISTEHHLPDVVLFDKAHPEGAAAVHPVAQSSSSRALTTLPKPLLHTNCRCDRTPTAEIRSTATSSIANVHGTRGNL